ncbi:MAG: helix-turn-helix domain-containing protein [Thermoanaerobaculales bacterium]
MTARPTPKEFGESLKRLRLDSNVTLEAISDRTKITVRILAALENGEFAKLPSQFFARMFLRQYLQAIDRAAGDWVAEFDAAWQHFISSSRPFVVGAVAPPRRRRAGPWVVGCCLVAAAVAAVLWVEKRNSNPQRAPAPSTPAPSSSLPRQVAVATPSPAPSPAPTTAPTPDPRALVIRTGETPCWVQVRVDGERLAARLLAPASTWEVQAGGRDVDLVLGDAGAASVAYLGQTRSPAGRRGEVARLHLTGAPRPAAKQP